MNDLMRKFNDKTSGEFDYLKISLIKFYSVKNILEINLLCPQKYESIAANEIKKFEKTFTDILKSQFKIEVHLQTFVFDCKQFISDLIKFFDNYPLVKTDLDKNNITFTENGTKLCCIKFNKSTVDYCQSINLSRILANYFKDKYYEDIDFKFISNGDSFEFSALEKEEQKYLAEKSTETFKSRRIRVTDVEKFIGEKIEPDAYYIEDVCAGEKIFCGTVSSFTQLKRKPREGESEDAIRPFYKFILTDFTGKINCLYFPLKSDLPKINKLKDGVSIIASGSSEVDSYGDARNFIFKIKSISFCKFPENFTPVVIKRSIPDDYICVKPKQYFNPVQKDLFGLSDEVIPNFLIGKKFCVFDTETTGLNPISDLIIEIGAVLIVDGKITQTFQSFINPHQKLSEKIKQLTSIQDEDLINAPEIKDVLLDFYKFSNSAALVGHNLQFDYDFISFAGKPYNIIFDNEQYDTLSLAQSYLSLRRNRLEDVAKFYSIVNEGAHRAIYDAITTAKIFIKLAENL